MAKLRFIVVGSGWRSLFYWRIAQALPERFELCAMLCRTEEKAEKMHREYGVPVSTSAEQCIALHPDFVVVAVNKASIAAVSTEWLARGFAVLCETPAALEEDALRALWQLHQQGAKLQVAEQYWLYPTLAKRLAAVRSGALGTPQFVRLSVAHGYHAVSLARQFLNAGQQPVRVTGRSWTEKIIETDSRWGAVHNGALVEKTLQQHTLEFAGGGTAFLDFNGVQYHSYLRSTHTSVQGERGELFDDTLRCLDAIGEPVCRLLTPLPDPLAAAAAQAGLNEDETAIACFLDRMQGYLAGGAEVYPLADALQDAYLALLMERALAAGQPLESTPQPWNTAAAVFSYESLNLEQRSAGYNIALGQHLHIVRAIGHDDGGCGGMAGCADGIQIDLQQRSAGGDLLALLDQCGKALTLHVHGIHADMDQQLGALAAGHAHSVQGGGDLGHSAVKGSVHGITGGLNAAAGAQNALCKSLVRDVGLCQHLALQRRQDRLALVGEFAGVFVLGLAAEQFVKKAHGECPSFLINVQKRQGNYRISTCRSRKRYLYIKDTISSCKKQEATLHKAVRYISVSSASTSSMRVAQLVAMRTTVWVSSNFSQKPNFALPFSAASWAFSSTRKIWLVGESIKKR